MNFETKNLFVGTTLFELQNIAWSTSHRTKFSHNMHMQHGYCQEKV